MRCDWYGACQRERSQAWKNEPGEQLQADAPGGAVGDRALPAATSRFRAGAVVALCCHRKELVADGAACVLALLADLRVDGGQPLLIAGDLQEKKCVSNSSSTRFHKLTASCSRLQKIQRSAR